MTKPTSELIDETRAMIYSIANDYRNFSNRDDLFQVGCIGVINAAKNYNSDFCTKFSTYSYLYVLGEIAKYSMNDRLIRVGTENAKLCKLYEKARDRLTNLYARTPSIKEISDFMEISEFELYSALSNSYATESLEKEIAEDLSLQDIIGEDDREKIDQSLDLNNELDKLTDLERDLINYRYYCDCTQSETAGLMGMSQVQVSREEKKILKRIKDKIAL